MMFADNFGKLYPNASRKFRLAVTTVPSMLNSITAWDLPIASTFAAHRAPSTSSTKRHERPFLPEGKFWLDPPKLLRSSKNPPSLVARFHWLIIIN